MEAKGGVIILIAVIIGLILTVLGRIYKIVKYELGTFGVYVIKAGTTKAKREGALSLLPYKMLPAPSNLHLKICLMNGTDQYIPIPSLLYGLSLGMSAKYNSIQIFWASNFKLYVVAYNCGTFTIRPLASVKQFEDIDIYIDVLDQSVSINVFSGKKLLKRHDEVFKTKLSPIRFRKFPSLRKPWCNDMKILIAEL